MSILSKLLGKQEPVHDPVCGMTIPATQARDFAVFQGTTYHFCSTVCREQFEREPERYVASAGAAQG